MSENKGPYVSKTGFVLLPILRGFTEIQNLYNMIISSVGDEAFICGGYVRYMASTRHDPFEAGDIDVYSMNTESFMELKSVLRRSYGLTVKHENDVSLTFSRCYDTKNAMFTCKTIQLIKPIKEGSIITEGSIEDIIDNFDFTVIRCGMVNRDMALVDADFEHDETEKILRLKKIHCPVSSTLRCMKYSKKGYWLPPTQALKLFIDWDGRGEDYRAKLQDFLLKANEGTKLTQEEVDELEALMRID